MIELVIADDQQLVRSGFGMIIGAEPDMSVIGEATDGAEAIRLVRSLRPDIVLMDVQMPGTDGLEATAEITAMADGPRVIILTTFERDDYVFTALRNGASGFLLKNAPPETLIEAIRTVASGDALLAPSVTRRLVEEFARRPGATVTSEAADRLTEREREVLVLLARGMTNAEIAEELFVGEATVKTHVSNVLTKLGLRDRVQAVVFAYENGVVTAGE
ncbi:MAG: response regulator transcription factor [Acidimicrobiia bacterium]|nr:response regulator transcription factor [Acidimicrobiia bacterium]